MSRRSDAPRLETARVLVHPAWLAGLALLFLNDRVFKGSGVLPGWLTGKLSDVAGLCVAPALLAACVRARSRRTFLLAHGLVALGFAAIELSSELNTAAARAYAAVGLDYAQWSDPTDLFALLVLPPAYLFCLRVAGGANVSASSSAPRSREIIGRVALVVGLLVCGGSVGPSGQYVKPCDGPDCDGDGYSELEDCNDQDPRLTPREGCPTPGEVSCDDGLDDDHDGVFDCGDPDCDVVCADLEAACAAAPSVDVYGGAYVSASTLGRSSLTESECLGADSPDTFLRIEQATEGTLLVGIPEGHGLSVRTACTDWRHEIACAQSSVKGPAPLAIPTIDSSLTVVIKAENPFLASSFVFPAAFRPATCGDGDIDKGEQCDDANLVGGDGCSDVCSTEYEAGCGYPGLVLGITDGVFDKAQPIYPQARCNGAKAGYVEQRYSFHPPQTGTLRLAVNAATDVALSAASKCEPSIPVRLGCADAAAGGGAETLSIPVIGGLPVEVFVALMEPPQADLAFTIEATLK